MAFAAELFEGSTPRAVLVTLASFVGLFAAPFLAARLLHGRWRLIGPARAALRDFAVACAAMAGAYAASMGVWALAYDSLPGVPSAAWLTLLPLTVVLLLIQTGAEEIAFRGYLQSQLAARFSSPVVWAVLPSLAFGAIHFDPAMPPSNIAAVVLSASLFGLVAADITARTGTLGAAWGLHFVNNFAALALLATPGSLDGLGLRRAPYGTDEPLAAWLVAADLALIAIAWAVLARLLSRPAPPA